MCEPTTIFAAAGQGLQAGSALSSGFLSGAQADRVALQTARAGRAARRQALATEEARRAGARAQLGALLADQSASGVLVSSGSVLSRAGRLSRDLEFDILTDRARGETRARDLESRAAQARTRARRARAGGVLSTASSLLGLGQDLSTAFGGGEREAPLASTAASGVDDRLIVPAS